MSPRYLALYAAIALGPYQTPGTEVRNRIDPRAVGVFVKPQVRIASLEPSSGCQGARDLRVSIQGSGFANLTTGLQVSLGSDIQVKVEAVRPDGIDLSVNIGASAPPGPRLVYVLRRGADRAVLQDGFTVTAGVDLTLGEPEAVVEPTRLVIRVPVKNIGCVISEPSLVSGSSSELGPATIDKVPAMAPGATHWAQMAFPLGEGHAAIAATIALTVDPEQRIAESNEENNQRSWSGQIPAAPAPIPTPEPEPVVVLPTEPEGKPIWPWVVGGGLLLGAGAGALRRLSKGRRDHRTTANLSWRIDERPVESRVERSPEARSVTLGITVQEVSVTHTIALRSTRTPADGGVPR